MNKICKYIVVIRFDYLFPFEFKVIDNLNLYFFRDTRSEEFDCSLARLERLFESNFYFMKELSLR